MKKLISLVLVFVMLAGQVWGATGVPVDLHWVAIGHGGGGHFTVVLPDHFTPDKIYGVPDVNAPFVSTDAAESWLPLSYNSGRESNFLPTQTASFIQSKTTASLMYAVDSSTNGMIKSIDGGASWTKIGNFKNSKGQRQIAIDPTDDNTVFVSSIARSTLVYGGRVWRSQDQGGSFQELFRPFDIPITGETAELTGSTQTRTGRLNSLANILKGSVVFTSSSGEVFTDQGNGTLTSNIPGGSGTINYTNPEDTGSNPGNYGKYSLTFGGAVASTTVSYTTSYTASWIHVTDDGEDILAGRDAATGTNLVRYNIASQTLTPLTLTGTNSTYVADFATYVNGSNVEHICVAAGYRVACTADKGNNFTYTAAATSTSTKRINKVAVKRNSDDSLNFVVNAPTITNSYDSLIRYSTDSGANWASGSRSNNAAMNPTAAFNFGNAISCIVADPFAENKFYLATDARIYRSDNSGQTFSEKDAGAQILVSTDIVVAPNGRYLKSSMDAGIQYSDDKGQTWAQAVPSAAKGQPYVTGSINDYGGHYWRIVVIPDEDAWANGTGKAVALATLYGSNTAVYYVNFAMYSDNNGTDWTRTNSGLPTVGLYGWTVWDHGYARAMGLSGDGTTLYAGMDGENCDADGAGGLPGDKCNPAGNNHQFGGLFKSIDFGHTWERIWSDPRRVFRGIAVDPTDATNKILLMGIWGINLYQKTGDATANYVGDSFGPGSSVYDTAYDYEGRPYAIGSNGGPVIYQSQKTTYWVRWGSWGTWRLMKRFSDASSSILKGILIDPTNKNRIFVSVGEGPIADRRVYVTTDAQNFDKATWYDITGDLPAVGGCTALALDPTDGDFGSLLCSTNGGDVYKIDLTDSPTLLPDGYGRIG